MSKNINYYSGLSLSKEELQFKDYADKYLSLYVDLIKSGVKDVVFVKNANDFEMTKGAGTPPVLNVNEGYCLFNGINDILTNFEYKQTLDIDDFPDQKFFVKSPSKTVTISMGLPAEKKYVYIQNYLVPAAFSCTVASDGTVTLTDTGSIRKSEVPSILRDINSNAPTRVRFLATDYSSTGINNNSIYEVNTVGANTITITGSVLAETGTVLCVPIGSFDLGSELNLENRALFSYNETRILVDSSSTLDNDEGIVKIGSIKYNVDGDDYEITDLRNSNKYIIAIDTEVDLSDYVTKSTQQTISASKTFQSLVQGRIASLTQASNFSGNFILINSGSGHGNDFIFTGTGANFTVYGFRDISKPFGTSPDVNLIPGTTIRVRFENIGTSFFNSTYFSTENNVPIKTGITYSIRLDSYTNGGIGGQGFSVSPQINYNDFKLLEDRVKQNEIDISTLNGDVAAIESNIDDIETATPEETVIRDEIHADTDIKIYLSYIKKGSYYLVTVTALVKSEKDSTVSSIIPETHRPLHRIYNVVADGTTEISITTAGSLIYKTGVTASGRFLFSVTYCTGITDFA